MATLLDAVRKFSHIDCDTMDAQAAQKFGPFADCTSNQAIAFFELSKVSPEGQLHHEGLFKEAVAQATGQLGALRDGTSLEAFAVEILMVKLQLLILPHVSNYVHIQTNPKLSYSKDGTIKNARRVLQIFKTLAPKEDPKRVCIKVPATWEGMQACRVLEAEGIATLATTMFCMEQAILAADANCTYIAPYINELRVHFDTEFQDQNKAFNFCLESQIYYQRQNLRTQVLAASFTCVEEVLELLGIHHLTLSPTILQELARMEAGGKEDVLKSRLEQTFNQPLPEERDLANIIGDESKWKLAFTRSGFGLSEGKLVQAICYFSDFQEKIESLLHGYVV